MTTTVERASCKSCGAAILWAITSAGARSPFDADPVEDGTWLLSMSQASGDLRAAYAGGSLRAGHETRNFYKSHFATCPNAASHRRPTDRS